MARPVCVVASGGSPFVSVSDGPPATPVADGPPITLVEAGAPPICLVNDDGSAWFENVADADYGWDFIANQAIWNSASIGALANTPNWTFTRASTGYAQTSGGVLVPFASGELRRTDKGVLIEGAGTNLCLQSQTFDNASWSKFEATVTANAASAPDGTLTADKIIADLASATLSNVNQSPTLTDSTDYTGSVYAKAGEWSWCFIVMRSKDSATETAAYFDLSNGVVGTAGSGITATITAMGNGWYRCSAKKNAGTGATAPRFRMGGTTADNTIAPTGDGTSGIYVWGAQLEAAAFPSSYIPTTTASATRAADSLSITGVTGLDYPLSLFAEFERAVDTGSTESFFMVDSGNATNRAELYVEASDIANVFVRSGGATQANIAVGSAVSVGTTVKTATRVAVNDCNIARSGTLGTADTSVTAPTTPTTVRFGLNFAGNTPCFGYLRRAAIWSRALTDAELQSVST